MIPKIAIEKAIEGGWKESLEIDKVEVLEPYAPGNPDFYRVAQVHCHHADMQLNYSMAEIALDPTFWQALSKALGWGTKWLDGHSVTVGRDGYLNAWQSYEIDFY